jgi:hypothetical protein
MDLQNLDKDQTFEKNRSKWRFRATDDTLGMFQTDDVFVQPADRIFFASDNVPF